MTQELSSADGADAGEEIATSLPASPALADLPVVTSDAALTFDEALPLCGRRGARLVMLMGEVKVGKTTVMVEIWSNLVAHGPIGGYRFGGSRTPIAFEERAFLSRTRDGIEVAATKRTTRDESGLLHIRVAGPDHERTEVLFADYAGEFFQDIREGEALLEVLPWAPRTDRAAIVIDGLGLATAGQREVAWNHARRQLLALSAEHVLSPSARVALVVAKRDAISDETFDALQPRLHALLSEARLLDPEAPLVEVAARPDDGSPPSGLEALLSWICMDDRAVASAELASPALQRAISRFGEF